jgi:hypothetical protein
MPRPGFQLSLPSYMSRVEEVWGIKEVVASAPALADMAVGEIFIGDGTESSPAAGSNAIYFKPDSATIVVIASNGSSLATRNIT